MELIREKKEKKLHFELSIKNNESVKIYIFFNGFRSLNAKSTTFNRVFLVIPYFERFVQRVLLTFEKIAFRIFGCEQYFGSSAASQFEETLLFDEFSSYF